MAQRQRILTDARPSRKPRTRAEMIDYLDNHFRYDTMGGWNQSTSYAVRVKLHCLNFPDKDTEDAAWDMLSLDGEEAFNGVRHAIRMFEIRHDYEWQIGSNGRSGGYYVLYQGGRKKSEHESRCEVCGQLNYKKVEGDGPGKCGRCGEMERYNLDAPVYQTHCYPGKSTDMGEDFTEWGTDDLRWRVDIVWDFDSTMEVAARAFVDFCKSHRVEDQTIMVSKEIRVAVAA